MVDLETFLLLQEQRVKNVKHSGGNRGWLSNRRWMTPVDSDTDAIPVINDLWDMETGFDGLVKVGGLDRTTAMRSIIRAAIESRKAAREYRELRAGRKDTET